eukprot:360874-Chlamydomonas_euryale.AAC.30
MSRRWRMVLALAFHVSGGCRTACVQGRVHRAAMRQRRKFSAVGPGLGMQSRIWDVVRAKAVANDLAWEAVVYRRVRQQPAVASWLAVRAHAPAAV